MPPWICAVTDRHSLSGRRLLPVYHRAVSVLCLLILFLVVPRARAAESAAAAAQASAIVESLAYADVAEARRAWQPMRGSAQAEVGTVAGRPALRLPCRFAGNDVERASWDRRLTLDLSGCRGIAFDFLCRDLGPIGQLNVYFQSGDGWYGLSFQPDREGAWCPIELDKSKARPEGSPAGWGSISAIRVSAWRAGAADTEVCLSSLRRTGVLGVDASVAIVVGAGLAGDDGGNARQSVQYAEAVAEGLGSFGIGCALLAESEVTRARLREAALVVLPHNPALSESAETALREHLSQDGGRLLAFYNLPAGLRSAVRIEVGRHLRDADRTGRFAYIRARREVFPEAPDSVAQRSWNINELRVKPGEGAVLAEWHDASGRPSGQPAVVATANCVMLSHVLLRDDPERKRLLLVALAGRAAPALWRQAVASALERAGRVGGAASFDEATAAISREAADKAPVRESLEAARAARNEALRMREAGRFAEALASAGTSGGRLMEAWCRSRRAQSGEFRGFWCHSAFGVDGMSWDEAVRRLAEAGFTAILPNMLWGGVAFHESRSLPVAAEVATRGDQIAECLAACRRYGIQLHVWKVNWNTGHRVPPSFLERMRAERRLQVSAKGAEEPWLCPSHPENRKLEIESMVEVARNYAVDGLHFDYIRYPGQEHCFCPGCRERFAKEAGVAIDRWPQAAQRGGALHGRWLDWRRSNIDAVVRAVSEQARAARPGIRISAAVFRNWSTDRDGVGQDWKLWCDKGWVDFLCPMDYTESERVFDGWVTRQREWAGRVPVYPGIGVSSSRTRLPADRTIRQIEITRAHGTGGFTLFNYGAHECSELLPLLGQGATARTP